MEKGIVYAAVLRFLLGFRGYCSVFPVQTLTVRLGRAVGEGDEVGAGAEDGRFALDQGEKLQ